MSCMSCKLVERLCQFLEEFQNFFSNLWHSSWILNASNSYKFLLYVNFCVNVEQQICRYITVNTVLLQIACKSISNLSRLTLAVLLSWCTKVTLRTATGPHLRSNYFKGNKKASFFSHGHSNFVLVLAFSAITVFPSVTVRKQNFFRHCTVYLPVCFS